MTLAREVDPRKFLVERHRDERVGLVIAQADVEPRAVLLDEGLLGEQRLPFAAEDDEFNRRDLGEHRVMAERPASGGGKVRRDALAHRDRLADVDHLPRRVAKEINARLVG